MLLEGFPTQNLFLLQDHGSDLADDKVSKPLYTLQTKFTDLIEHLYKREEFSALYNRYCLV